jgi:hypothetical protein
MIHHDAVACLGLGKAAHCHFEIHRGPVAYFSPVLKDHIQIVGPLDIAQLLTRNPLHLDTCYASKCEGDL